MNLLVSTAWAHETAPAPAVTATAGPRTALTPLEPFSWTTLDVHWSTVIGIIALLALYLWAVARLRRSFAPRGVWPVRHTVFFVVGLVVLFFSLNGPIHDLSDTYLFS